MNDLRKAADRFRDVDRLKRGALVRCGSTAVIWLFFLMAYRLEVIDRTAFQWITLCGLLLVLFSPPLIFLLKRVKDAASFHRFLNLVNITEALAFTLVIYVAGGVRVSYLTLFYTASIAYLSTVRKCREVMIVASCSVAFFTLMVFAEYAGVIPHMNGKAVAFPTGSEQILVVAMVGATLLLIAFLSTFGTYILRRDRDRSRRKIEDRLSHSEARYHHVIETIEDGYYDVDLKGNLVYFNNALCHILGYDREELSGINYQHYMDSENIQTVYQTFNRVFATGEPDKAFEWVFTKKDGTRIYLDTSVSVKTDVTGTITGFRGILRDQTARRNAEQELVHYRHHLEQLVRERTAELRDSNAKLHHEISERIQFESKIVAAKQEWERTFDAIADGITIHDENNIVRRANKAAAEMLALPYERIVGQACHEVFSCCAQPCPNCPREEAVCRKKACSVDMKNFRPGCTHRVTISPLQGEKGDFEGVVHIVKDVTEAKKLERQLRQAQKMESIGKLAGGIAHDFNNLLAPIIGFAEMALDDLPGETPAAENVTEILNAGLRARDLIRQILTFSHKGEEKPRPVELQEIAAEALKLLRATIPSTIRFNLDLDPGCRPVIADPTQIHQVIMNLCTNAWHAMRDSGGSLTVTLREMRVDNLENLTGSNLPSGRYARLTVSDTGSGMDPETVKLVFDPYFTTKKSSDGTGLGLSVVHGIVCKAGGSIQVSSRPQEGSTFDVYLPCAASEAAADMSTGVCPTAGGCERVMVVDDEVVIGKMIAQMLDVSGYQATVFQKSPEALAAFKAAPRDWDLMVTDMTMPDLTGAELAREILKIDSSFPIVLCSGFSDAMTPAKARAAGIGAYLAKPILKADLSVAIQQALDCCGIQDGRAPMGTTTAKFSR